MIPNYTLGKLFRMADEAVIEGREKSLDEKENYFFLIMRIKEISLEEEE